MRGKMKQKIQTRPVKHNLHIISCNRVCEFAKKMKIVPHLPFKLFLFLTALAFGAPASPLTTHPQLYHIFGITLPVDTSYLLTEISQPSGAPTTVAFLEELGPISKLRASDANMLCRIYATDAREGKVELCLRSEGRGEWVWPQYFRCKRGGGRVECEFVEGAKLWNLEV
ncbi:hypothetical protein EV356DRAFT_54528 [Viridothelium virens]|uniref:Uncharacterized protein n=1 Tax=Viridothelium virens TaxID=1048519 RepID=A0A6A6HG54_VIRVR|nr:hypothetical protein EV356DRAFT_54528 [Viridothelium virens]